VKELYLGRLSGGVAYRLFRTCDQGVLPSRPVNGLPLDGHQNAYFNDEGSNYPINHNTRCVDGSTGTLQQHVACDDHQKPASCFPDNPLLLPSRGDPAQIVRNASTTVADSGPGMRSSGVYWRDYRPFARSATVKTAQQPQLPVLLVLRKDLPLNRAHLK